MKRKAAAPPINKKPHKKPRAGYSTVPRTRGPLSFGSSKYFDTIRTATAIQNNQDWSNAHFPPNVGTPTTLCVPVTGSDINNRVGREIDVYKISVRGTIKVAPQANQTATDQAAVVRLLLVQDTETNGTQATGTQIMTGTTSGGPISVHSHMSLASLGRFKMLKDKTFCLSNPNISWDGTNMEQQGIAKVFKFVKRWKKPVRVRFNATNGGTISDIVNHSWCIYAMLGETDLATTLLYNARVYYKDPQ